MGPVEGQGIRIEDLPVEMMVEIFSNLKKTEKMKVSMVNRRWFGIANSEIKTLSIKWPQEKNQDFQNLIMRFPRRKNIELTVNGIISRSWFSRKPDALITNKDQMLPLEFEGTLEFDINKDLIQTKNPKHTRIERIRINPAKEQNFEYNQIIRFGIDLENSMPQDYDSVVEEVRSLENVLKIEYADSFFGHEEDGLNFAKIIKTMLICPILKQIVLDVAFDNSTFFEDTEEVFPKNLKVEKITFNINLDSLLFKVWNKLFNALPNIKQVKVVSFGYNENLPVFLKHISILKNLKSLNWQIYGRDEDEKFDAQNFGHLLEIKNCCDIIKNNFPMNSEVVIADLDGDDYLTNLIEKEEGENPKIVIYQF